MKIKLLRMIPNTAIVLSTTTRVVKGDPKQIIYDTCKELLIKYKEYYSDVTIDMYVILMEAVFDYLEDLSIMMYSDEDWWLEEYSVHRLWIK
jgi:hypothetical protein